MMMMMMMPCTQAAADQATAVGRLAEPGVQWQAVQPVFACIPAPLCAQLLTTPASMLQREAELRSAVCSAVQQVMESAFAGVMAETSGQIMAPRASPMSEQRQLLEQKFLVWLSCWLQSPCVHEGAAEEVVVVLADDMAGY